jgi:regulatory helix-turn-helix LysR family protein
VAEPSFTLVQLRHFAAAAEHGSMAKASRELMVSQSAISTAVAARDPAEVELRELAGEPMVLLDWTMPAPAGWSVSRPAAWPPE